MQRFGRVSSTLNVLETRSINRGSRMHSRCIAFSVVYSNPCIHLSFVLYTPRDVDAVSTKFLQLFESLKMNLLNTSTCSLLYTHPIHIGTKASFVSLFLVCCNFLSAMVVSSETPDNGSNGILGQSHVTAQIRRSTCCCNGSCQHNDLCTSFHPCSTRFHRTHRVVYTFPSRNVASC